jgi:hypothetical protein
MRELLSRWASRWTGFLARVEELFERIWRGLVFGIPLAAIAYCIAAMLISSCGVRRPLLDVLAGGLATVGIVTCVGISLRMPLPPKPQPPPKPEPLPDFPPLASCAVPLPAAAAAPQAESLARAQLDRLLGVADPLAAILTIPCARHRLAPLCTLLEHLHLQEIRRACAKMRWRAHAEVFEVTLRGLPNLYYDNVLGNLGEEARRREQLDQGRHRYYSWSDQSRDTARDEARALREAIRIRNDVVHGELPKMVDEIVSAESVLFRAIREALNHQSTRLRRLVLAGIDDALLGRLPPESRDAVLVCLADSEIEHLTPGLQAAHRDARSRLHTAGLSRVEPSYSHPMDVPAFPLGAADPLPVILRIPNPKHRLAPLCTLLEGLLKAIAPAPAEGLGGYGLRCLSAEAGVDLPTVGRNLVIVADVDGELCIRVFNAWGRQVADITEYSEPERERHFATLRSLLGGSSGETPLSQLGGAAVAAVTSIVGEIRSTLMDHITCLRDRFGSDCYRQLRDAVRVRNEVVHRLKRGRANPTETELSRAADSLVLAIEELRPHLPPDLARAVVLDREAELPRPEVPSRSEVVMKHFRAVRTDCLALMEFLLIGFLPWLIMWLFAAFVLVAGPWLALYYLYDPFPSR